MLIQLKRRLILVYTLTTGLLLTIVVMTAFLLNSRQLTENYIQSFERHFRTVTEQVEGARSLSYNWLSKMEAENHLLISISSNDIPLEFSGVWEPPTPREKLFERLNQYTEKSHMGGYTESPRTVSPVYSLYGQEGEHYYGCVSVKREFGKNYVLEVIWQLKAEPHQRMEQRIFFLLIDLFGIGGLFFISIIIVNQSLNPLKAGLKRQNEFIAAASHELRSPLTVIRAGMSALKADVSKADEFIPRIEREGERMAVLIDDMLMLASSDAKTWVLRQEPIEVDTFLIALYDSLVQFCKKKQQKLELLLGDGELLAIMGDKQRLEQILIILIDNASSYSPEASVITIYVSEIKKYLQIEIIDRGCGISEEDKERIFERFYRVDKSRNDKKHFGLGLSIAWELALLQQGKILIRDTEGGGSTFVLQLPVMGQGKRE